MLIPAQFDDAVNPKGVFVFDGSVEDVVVDDEREEVAEVPAAR